MSPDHRLHRAGLPAWLAPVAEVSDTVEAAQLSRFLPPPTGGRDSAVLMLFAGAIDLTDPGAADVLLIQRARTLTAHPGQPAFPGGAADPGDGGPVGTALREAVEETGLDPAGVQPFGLLPQLHLPMSGFVVTPVLAWWAQPSPVQVIDPGEVTGVYRVPVADLLDPANRVRVRHSSGYVGPAFEVAGMFVWGFTAGLLSRMFALTGWELPWDEATVRPFPGAGSR